MSTIKGRKAATASSSSWAIVLAGGRASGFSAEIDPVFLSLGSKPVLTYTIAAVERCPEVEGVVIVASKERVESLRSMVHMYGSSKVKAIVPGAATRDAMIRAGLAALADHHPGFIAVLDGAIPGVTPELIGEAVRAARKHGASSVARQIVEPIAESTKGFKITGLPNGSTWWSTVGPQVFRTELLERALANAAKKKLHPADEAAAVAALKQDVHLVPTRRMLVRIDGPADLMLAEYLLRH